MFATPSFSLIRTLVKISLVKFRAVDVKVPTSFCASLYTSTSIRFLRHLNSGYSHEYAAQMTSRNPHFRAGRAHVDTL
jgi:hypothetical protein